MRPKDKVSGVSDEGAIAELSERLGRARERLDAARESHAQLARMLEDAHSAVPALAEECAAAREAEAILVRERDEIDAELAPLVEGLQRNNDDRSDELALLQRRRIQCDRDLAQCRETISRCTKRIAGAESLRDHPEVVENERRRVEELEAEVAFLSEELATAEGKARHRRDDARHVRLRRVAPLVVAAVCVLVVVAAIAGRALLAGGRADAPTTVSDFADPSALSAKESLSLQAYDAGDIDLTGYSGLRTVEVGLASSASLDVSGLDGLERLTLKSGEGFATVNLSGCSSLTDLAVFAPVDEFVVDSDTNGALVRKLRLECQRNGWSLTEL